VASRDREFSVRAIELMAAGIPEADIVLAFKLPELQKVRSRAVSRS
jgi:hypothetical protein